MKHPSPIDLSRALVEGVDDRLRAHLDICDECNEALATHAAIADDVRQLPVVDPDENRARLLRASIFAAARTASPAPRRSFFLGFALAGGLAAAAVAALVLLRTPGQPPHVARGTIQPHEGADVVHIDKPDEIVRLSSGTVTVQVAALDAHERFRVVIGDAEIESRGAAFDVRAKRDRLESVRVYDGRVEIRADGARPRTLVAGERWEIELAQNTKATDPANGAIVATIETPTNSDSAKPVPATVEPVVVESADVDAASVEAAKRDRIDPAVAAAVEPVQTSSREATTRTPSRPESRDAPATQPAPSKIRSIDKAPLATPTAATKSQPTKPGASNIQATDNPSIARPARAKRPIEVLFDEGFATLTSGDPAAAAAIFERAARSAPKDPLAEDATFWRASALVRAKSAAAASALETFLATYASSPRVGEASAMLGWLVMDRDLDRAEKLFTAANTDRVASVRASATKGLAAVAARRAK